MAKFANADEFIALVKNGEYAAGINAKRGVGRSSLSTGEKKKALEFIASYFPENGSAPAKPSKKVGKKKATKRAAKVTASAPVGKKKKVTRKVRKPQLDTASSAEAAAAPEGTIPMSPSEVSSVADVLRVVDSTVTKSVSIMAALAKVRELGPDQDISDGVTSIKNTLTGAAQVLNGAVIAPLNRTAPKADPEVAARLEQVVAAVAPPSAPSTNHAMPPPPPAPAYVPPPAEGTA